MGLAALISEQYPTGEFRHMIHDEVDKWVDRIIDEVFVDGKEPTIMELSQLFSETKQKFFGACFQALIEQKYAGLLDQEYAPCPQCEKRCKKRRGNLKKMVTMQGPSALKRPWFFCVECSYGFSPLDKALEISRKKYQFDVQKKSTRTTAEVPFSTGSELFFDLTDHAVSDHFMHDTFEDVGAYASLKDVIPSREEIAERCQGVNEGSWRPVLVVASDGAHVPTRPKAKRNEKRGKGRWQEAKGFRIYLLGEDRIEHIASWHQIQNEEQFGEDLSFVASLIPQDDLRIGLLGDGADWLWKHMVACFPKGRQILDYFHCAEHVHKVAKVQYGEGSQKCLEWVESTITRLFYAEVDNVIWGLERMKPGDSSVKEEIRKLIGYLHNNRERIHYHGDRIGGYPIGSGGIESANKFISHTRMKRSGAWWVKETGNEMLGIRCAIYNGTYDKVFVKYKKARMAL
ncbi:MAG: ISKra4 family transposase [Thermodesulfobacteriota bacterium]|nr:ISKra4 family transposase [Thermodesulfobacteriota bacterium]